MNQWAEYVVEAISTDLRKYIVDAAKMKKAVVGVSGGIDSAVVLKLSIAAVGPQNVVAVMMPCGGMQFQEETEEFVKRLGVQLEYIDIFNMSEEVVKPFTSQIVTDEYYYKKNIFKGNIYARLRMIILYSIASLNKGLVIGTTNKTESLLGYFTKYGDGGVDIEPILELYKTEVRLLAKEIGIPEFIQTRPPSAELWEDQSDEEELGITYEEIDKIAALLERNYSIPVIMLETDYPLEKIQKILKISEQNMHKNKLPPSIKIIDLNVLR